MRSDWAKKAGFKAEIRRGVLIPSADGHLGGACSGSAPTRPTRPS